MFRVEHANTIRLYLSRLPVSSPRALFLPPPRSSFPPVAALIGMRVALGVTGMQWWRTSGIVAALIEMRVALGVAGMQWWRTNGLPQTLIHPLHPPLSHAPSRPPSPTLSATPSVGADRDARGLGSDGHAVVAHQRESRVRRVDRRRHGLQRDYRIGSPLEAPQKALAAENVANFTAYNVITVPGLLPSSFTKLKTLTYLDLSSNRLNASLDQFARPLLHLPNLRVLTLNNNKLWGSVPSYLLQKPKLQKLVDDSPGDVSASLLPATQWTCMCAAGATLKDNDVCECEKKSSLRVPLASCPRYKLKRYSS
ncbi:unnamed protein product [Closterium sp. NIES-65]|nr:unnamed protein product [Closterium sp. NIES-65]